MPLTIYLWKINARMIGGRAAMIPPAINPLIFTPCRPKNSEIATGVVFAAVVEVKIRA